MNKFSKVLSILCATSLMFSSAYAADNNVEPEDDVSISVSQNADFIEALGLSQPALFSLSNSSLRYGN